ncbi:hypothetical protein VE01_10089 [Pseudogymnoascus verrucosus]|uniref:Serine aminopeptidase S33 domain-containing protein n=1 Tax=Pseudogymnoascus verrucosus TaxID=342668 RepID=A0A1B8G8H5_9PEZI|nr:uncharacterized protein VE01_10089 [Pseudogymnoascus verrucosus]OBT92133.1 hypothetical protein VE01_10089 [Pseudogymnoascus verrucosus]
MTLLHCLRSSLPDPSSTSNIPLIALTSLTTLSLLHLTRLALSAPALTTRGPTSTLLPHLSQAAREGLEYPPDILPGGRDVDTPYGSIRVHEWGPETGPKILMVHGITTPCLALGGLAHGLVEKGYRVMLFDLFGRGYSDTPTSLPHDLRLYTTQLLLVLSSSSLPWCVPGGFTLLGYSLGGGIASGFASYFPHLVSKLILLAPAGLIRPQHMSSRSTVLYCTGLIPESWLVWLCERRLLAGPMYAKENKAPASVLDAELPGQEGVPNPDFTPLSLTRPYLTVPEAVQWQLRHHPGFVPAFLSCIRYAPITGQQEIWERLRRGRTDEVLLVVGTEDPIVLPDEVREDAEKLLGEGRVRYVEVGAAHDFVITDVGEVVEAVVEFLEGGKGKVE